MTRRTRTLAVLLLVIASGAAALLTRGARHADRVAARTTGADGRGSVTLLSRTHTIDRIYQSMQGPHGNHAGVELAPGTGQPELLWLTGVRTEIVGPDGLGEVSREFFCHANLTFAPDRLSARRTGGATFTDMPDMRLFTLVPGRLSIGLPAGFGVPVYSDEPLDFFSMSLNLNVPDRTQRLRFKTTVDYVRGGAPAARGMRPLFRRSVYGFEPIGRASPHAVCHSATHPGAACGAFVAGSASDSFVASVGTANTIHWMIPPGRYESRVPVTGQLALPYDTAAHYVTAHLHPFGKSVALVDKTDGVTLFTIVSEDFHDRLGVARMDELALPEGTPLSKDHEYELVTVYDNPTDRPADVMSILYIYALDKQFHHPDEQAGPVATVGR
jgi:hypothetical protein